MGKLSTKFDFLVNMHEMNPQVFEEYRKEVIDEYIQSLPEDRRLKAEQSQWVLEGELSKCKDPIDRMKRMAELLAEGLAEFTEIMEAVGNIENEHETTL